MDTVCVLCVAAALAAASERGRRSDFTAVVELGGSAKLPAGMTVAVTCVGLVAFGLVPG